MKKKMNKSSWPFGLPCVWSTSPGHECKSEVPDGMCTFWKSDLTPFPTDGVIKAYKLSPGQKTQASKEPSPGLEALRARCEGPTEGPDPSQADPENPHITEGALTGHRHLQGFEKMEWKTEEKEKSEMVQIAERAAGTAIYNDGNVPGWEPVLVKMHADWCARVPFSSTKRLIFIHEREQDCFVRRLLMCTRQIQSCIPTSFYFFILQASTWKTLQQQKNQPTLEVINV